MLKLLTILFSTCVAFSALATTGLRSDCESGRRCAVILKIDRYSQLLTVLENGRGYLVTRISSGDRNLGTPEKFKTPTGPIDKSELVLDRHPTGQIAENFSDCDQPGAFDCDASEDNKTLSPNRYAVFLAEGFPLYGVPRKYWSRLGVPGAHLGIRVHPAAAKQIYDLVRKYGPSNTRIRMN